MTGFWSSHGTTIDAHIGRAAHAAGRPPDGGGLTATIEGEARPRDRPTVEGGPRDVRSRAIAALSDLARDHLVDEADGHVVAATVKDRAGRVVLAAELSVETTWFDRDGTG